MKKKHFLQGFSIARHFLILTSVFYLLTSATKAQQGEWTWMKGDMSANSPGVFGTKGVGDANNTPPALYGAAMWLDTANNIWLFGGAAYFNTLWKYDMSTNDWTWMNGTSVNSAWGAYGTMGVPSPLNTPGARGYGFLSWKDLNGDFWIYGGDGYDINGNEGLLSDLWKYSVATNEWAWMNGSTFALPSAPPVYGTLGVPAATNTPGGREETTVSWVDTSGNLWFFGGFDNYITPKSDVWKYDVTLNEWVWMAGQSGSNAPPVYGTMGVSSPTNTPGGRNAYGAWSDLSGNFWLFGGGTIGTSFGDLWKLDLSTLEWTWMSGSNTLGSGAVSGAQCVSDTSFYPASRSENRACWRDKCGNFWMFGGSGYYNDVWAYRPAYGDWTFANGSLNAGASASYGQQGVSSPSNNPGGRYGCPAVYDQSGNVWIFGGHFDNGNYGNDLWRFVPDTTCPASPNCSAFQVPSFASSDTNVCEKFCVNFTDQSNNNPVAWLWLFPGGDPSSSTLQNPTNICYNTPGVYDVTLITTNANGSDTLTLHNFITVYATPPFPTITQAGYTLTSSPAVFYQWQLNSADIPGATNQSYTVLQSGFYTVIVSDSNGCVNSASIKVTISGIEELNDGSVSVYPNPSSGNFIIELLNGLMADEVLIDVVNTLGQKVFSSQQKISATAFKKQIDLSNFAHGVYFIEIKTEHEFLRKKIVIAE